MESNQPNIYTATRRSSDTAEMDAFVLRQKETTRLIFKPIFVNNENNNKASIKGTFIFQKKGKLDNWENFDTVPLSSLKSGEGVKLELHSVELLDLISHLAGLYRIYRTQGLPNGKAHFIKIAIDRDSASQLRQGDVKHLIDSVRHIGSEAIFELLNWASSLENTKEVVSQLSRLEVDSLERINSVLGITTLKSILSIWYNNKNNSSEEFWQKTFQTYSFILSQLFMHPVVFIEDKAYVGGKNYKNTGGHIVDFLLKNHLTQNAALIEIKTPTTPLLGKQYRTGSYSLSEGLVGSVSQALTYQQSLTQEFIQLSHQASQHISAFSPQCIIIIGNASHELDAPDKTKSFELFRGALHSKVCIMTFDEVFEKARQILNLMEGGTQT